MKYFLAVLVFVLTVLGVLYLGSRIYEIEISKKISLESPLPGFLNFNTSSDGVLGFFWRPVLEDIEAEEIELAPTARAALIYNLTDEKLVYGKNVDQRYPMASLTKIMTAVVAIENKREDDRYLVLEEHLVGENSMGLTAGEVMSLEELMYGLVLMSGNDTTEVFAANFPGGRNEFIKRMNSKAKEIGMKDTNFTNPSGLQGDGDQYTTAQDYLILTKYALDNSPLFAKVAATYEKEIPQTSTHKYFYLTNETNLLSTYEGVKGVKTGYTPEAGYCLVTYLDYGGKEYIGIILGSQNRRQEMKDLLDFSLRKNQIDPPELKSL